MDEGIHILDDGTIKILIPEAPVTKKNNSVIFYIKAKAGKMLPRIGPSKAYKKYARRAGKFLEPLGIMRPVNVQAIFFMKTRRRVDLTNLNEALHDILVENGVLSDDNARIIVSTDGSRVCFDKDFPRTEVTITDALLTFPEVKK